MRESLWAVVEVTCRILGVSTATVLCAVGVETLQQGDFNSLGIYLLVSSVGMMMFELAYFLDAMLATCLPCPPDWQLFMLWGKMAHVGGFHKFLYYSIMSLVCFLHPVLVWHAIIPGIMLLVTAVFNFILSKKSKGPKRDQDLTAVCVSDRAGAHTFSGRHSPSGSRPEESGRAVREKAPKESRWKEMRCLLKREEPVGREMEVMGGDCEPETTSDTAPMIID
ncbi:transmembrane protein 72 [Neosynchiropus ocellatus]